MREYVNNEKNYYLHPETCRNEWNECNSEKANNQSTKIDFDKINAKLSSPHDNQVGNGNKNSSINDNINSTNGGFGLMNKNIDTTLSNPYEDNMALQTAHKPISATNTDCGNVRSKINTKDCNCMEDSHRDCDCTSNTSNEKCDCTSNSSNERCDCNDGQGVDSHSNESSMPQKDIESNEKWHENLCSTSIDENSYKVLQGVYDNTIMARDSLNRALPHITNEHLKMTLEHQVETYDNLQERCIKLANSLGFALTKKEGLRRAMTNTMVSIKSALNSSTGQHAEMILKGTLMGVIDMQRLLRKTTSIHPEVLEVARQTMIYEESKMQMLKAYL